MPDGPSGYVAEHKLMVRHLAAAPVQPFDDKSTFIDVFLLKRRNAIAQPSPPDHAPAELIVDFDFFDVPEGMTDPTEIWHGLVRRGVPPIFYTRHNGGHWVFLNYNDIVEGYRNHEIFSTYQTPIPPIEPFPVMMPQGVDPSDKNEFRQLLAPMFTPLAVRKMTERLQHRAQTPIAGFTGSGGCDFIADYAAKFPAGTFLDLFGLPEEQMPEFLQLANVFFRSTDSAVRAANVTEIYAVLETLFLEKEKILVPI